MSRDAPTTRVYVGNLGDYGNKAEIEREFESYGAIQDVWVARNPPGFAFVEFRDYRDAEDAVRDMDGKKLCGQIVKVELSRREGRDNRFRRGAPRGRSGGRYDRSYDDRDYRGRDRSGDRYNKFGDERNGGYDRRGSPTRRSPPRRGGRSPDGGRRSRSRSPRPVRY